MGQQSAPPLVFISHKHADRAIANVVRGFVTEQTKNDVRVFQSSDSSAGAIVPEVGRTLNEELRRALWEAQAVILVYTTQDQDWGYCMWECGVATHPASPDTRIIVLQCADSVPSLFAGQVRVNARDRNGVIQFVTQFMTSPSFLPGVPEPLTGYEKSAPEVSRAANKFFDDLQAVLPEFPVSEWPAHPFIQFQLSLAAVKGIADIAPDIAPDLRASSARAIVLSEASVSDGDRQGPTLFGMAEFDGTTKLQTLVATWRATYPALPQTWVECLADQIGKAALWQFPILRWCAMPAVTDGQLHAPVVTRVRRLPAISSMQFDAYFYPFNLLDATPVTSRMVGRSDMFCWVLEPGGEDQVRVLDLVRQLQARRHRRAPFVNHEDRLVYIAHRSMLDEFLVQQVGITSSLDQLTLADLFRERADVRDMFTNSAAFVGAEATLGDAKLAMSLTPQCYDVFVTATGKADEAVVGWVTDVTIADSEPS